MFILNLELLAVVTEL